MPRGRELITVPADRPPVPVRPPFLAVLYLSAAAGLHLLLPTPRVIPPPYHYLGPVLAGGGLALILWALLTMRRQRTTHEPFGVPVALVVTGPYAFTRNPMYLGVTGMLLGAALWVGTLPLFFAPLAFSLTMDRSQIPYEEAKLQRIFGQAYDGYCRRVRRWL
jgi:protein-S-isoprenylcysteine O-methyltransferase Ste14